MAKAFFFYNSKDKKEHSENLTVEDYEININRVLCECPNYDLVIDSLLKIGYKKLIINSSNISKLLEYCHITPGIPCKPMLAKPMKSI